MYNNHSVTRNVKSNSKCKKQLLDMRDVYTKFYSYNDKWKLGIQNFDIVQHIENVFKTYSATTKYKGDV